MKRLNLTSNEAEAQYNQFKFPDGQQQITITSNYFGEVIIDSRLTNFMDLELICCAVKSLNGLDINPRLYISYFLGARSDRKFEVGSNNYLKDVICPIINSLNVKSVSVLNPHSDVLEACLNNFISVPDHDFTKWALTKINNTNGAQEKTIFLSPDSGALKKIYKTAEYVGFDGEILNCNKIRDLKGQITKTEVPHFNLTKDVVIFDDICDGGRTFIEIAKIIKQRQENYDREKNPTPTGKIYLVVTHGIFSKGYSELGEYFDSIFCTNSYKNIPEKEWDGDKRDVPTKIKQYKVI